MRSRSGLARTAVIGMVVLVLAAGRSGAANPIVEGMGLCDPQVRVYDDHVYLYATHDALPGSKSFVMHDWWVWTTDDLLHWTQVSTLKPEDTYFRKPSAQCWATDAIRRNGKYYFYFSRGPKEIGVVVGDSPVGPWRDPTGKPLIAEGSTPTLARDPGILQEPDGTTYIVFGCWDYYIARLNADMISLAETPRLLELDRKMGPYGPGKTDDKPFLHRRGDQYYLSWGCYYAMSPNVYGPYVYKDTIIHEDRVEPAFRKALTFDRHGSFFELHNQWYFICNDQSWPGTNRYYRDSVLSYVHYRDNGEIEPIDLNRLGVGQYDAAAIPAAEYYGLAGGAQRQSPAGGFEVGGLRAGSTLDYPNVRNVPANATFTMEATSTPGCAVEVRSAGGRDALMGTCTVPPAGDGASFRAASCRLTNAAGSCDVRLVVRGGPGDLLRLKSIRFDAGHP
jgi:arabinoxylan arabinofuranohydrolase